MLRTSGFVGGVIFSDIDPMARHVYAKANIENERPTTAEIPDNFPNEVAHRCEVAYLPLID